MILEVQNCESIKNKLGLSCAKLSSSLVSIKFAELVTLFRMGGGAKTPLHLTLKGKGTFTMKYCDTK